MHSKKKININDPLDDSLRKSKKVNTSNLDVHYADFNSSDKKDSSNLPYSNHKGANIYFSQNIIYSQLEVHTVQNIWKRFLSSKNYSSFDQFVMKWPSSDLKHLISQGEHNIKIPKLVVEIKDLKLECNGIIEALLTNPSGEIIGYFEYTIFDFGAKGFNFSQNISQRSSANFNKSLTVENKTVAIVDKRNDSTKIPFKLGVLLELVDVSFVSFDKQQNYIMACDNKLHKFYE